MSDNQFYNEVQQRFAKIIEQNKRQKRRNHQILFPIHAAVLFAATLFTWYYVYGTSSHYYAFEDNGWPLVSARLITLIAHGYAVFAANNTTIQDTVFESLMLLMAQNELKQDSGKSKRQDETYSLSDDGELTTPQRQVKRNGSS